MQPHILWTDSKALRLLDQRLLPGEVVLRDYRTAPDVAAAIREMVVRGAPAIGVTAAYAMALSAGLAATAGGDVRQGFLKALRCDAKALKASRPTAVNLAWAVDRCLHLAQDLLRMGAEPGDVAVSMEEEALRIHLEDVEACKAIGRHGAPFVPPKASVLTHCNAGALATGGYGTALGVIRAASADGRVAGVLVDETRPFLQGARLTAWELAEDGIPVSLICDNMAGALMAQGKVDVVVVGADRIAANGDTANKIGTFSLAVLAAHHGIPFLVAAPRSTFDAGAADGTAIPIEQRPEEEVLCCGGARMAPPGVGALNPAFDVTPHALIHAIVTEDGPLQPVNADSVGRFLARGV